MLDTLKRITIGSSLLLLMPLLVILSGWKWKPTDTGWGHLLMFGITESINYPWIVWTSIILCSWFAYCIRCSCKSTIFFISILILSLLVGEGIKDFIKEQTKELRPYRLWILENYATKMPYTIKETDFLLQDKVFRSSLDPKKVPLWLIEHWSHTNSFSFPSGHTMFASTWSLIGIGVLWPRRCYYTVFIVTMWALAVMGSRLIFGMHWPIDLIVSIIFSGVLATLVTMLFQRIKTVDTIDVSRDRLS
ncbi:phosphatase PAP2 family protein [Candidatus Erwinia haradaeae]|uniref:undecaprenyl-diphosphate phosphatase n=1 Tax=Candidatus Erwinia haradaeae TaxID=1922217 RepID=A0A803FTV6_9GAMM|nr:phosphatase PAP2 family protein [Candidatus Erwinia haradaeae]VFP88288.1 Phosphatidylglycerophosphatase B [Candidatus Erwinia haradaeae]